MTMDTRTPAWVTFPGEFIREELDARGWTEMNLADAIGSPASVVSDLIAGKCPVTPEIARGLGAAFGTSMQLWINLEDSYQRSRHLHQAREMALQAHRTFEDGLHADRMQEAARMRDDFTSDWDRNKPITSRNHPPCDYCDEGCPVAPCTCGYWDDVEAP